MPHEGQNKLPRNVHCITREFLADVSMTYLNLLFFLLEQIWSMKHQSLDIGGPQRWQCWQFAIINQSNFYSANISGVARLSGTTSKSVLNSKIDEAVPQRQQVIGHADVCEGKARSKRYVLRQFLKVETEMDERTDSGKLFQREGSLELNDLFPTWVLTLGTKWFFYLISVNVMEVG